MDPERAALVGAPPGQADRRRAGTKNYPNLAVALVTLVSATLMVIANRNTLALPTLGAAPHGERPHRQTVMSWSSTHKQRAHSQLSPGTPGFPMVRQLVRHGEEGALQIVQRNWDSYHRNGANALTPLYLPDVTLWPEGGGYEELTSVIARDNGLIEGTTIGYLKMVPRKEEAAYDASSAGDVLDLSGGRAVNSGLKKGERAISDLIPAAVLDRNEDFADTALGHLAGWLEARSLGKQSLVMSDWSNLITNHMGPPQDFDTFLMSFLYKGPKKWDVLFLDKGERGVETRDLEKPFLTLRNEKQWADDYFVYRNKMSGVAGAGFYAVSGRFLEKLPELLKQFPFTAVDGWLSVLCRDEHLSCFSHTQRNWFYGLTSEHLKGHHPPDVKDVPTSELLFNAGGGRKGLEDLLSQGRTVGKGGLKKEAPRRVGDTGSSLGKKKTKSASKSRHKKRSIERG